MKWHQWALLIAFLLAVVYLAMTGSKTRDANGNVVDIDRLILLRTPICWDHTIQITGLSSLS